MDAARRAALESVVPRPSCPSAADVGAPGESEVIVDYFRVERQCLVLHSEIVSAAKAFDRIAELRTMRDVTSADLRPVVVLEDDAVRRAASPASSGDDTDNDDGKDPGDVLRDIGRLDRRDLWAYDALDVETVRETGDHLPGLTVAVIDSAIDRTHIELEGTDFIVPRGLPVADGEGGSHGTLVSGVIAPSEQRGTVLHRVARNVRVMSIPLLSMQVTNAPESVGDAIRWAVDHGAYVINLSISVQCGFKVGPVVHTWDCLNEVAQDAVFYALGHGRVVVAAVGNYADEGSPIRYPAGYEGVIGVGSHDRNGEREPSSSVNETVDVSAPGAGVLVAGHTGARAKSCPRGYTDGHNQWCVVSGTSVAAPFVSATVAWLMTLDPAASPSVIESALRSGARLPPGQRPGTGSDEFGYGYLDPMGAAEVLVGDTSNRDLVAYRADLASTLGVADLATGDTAVLAHVEGSAGTPSDPVRWSPDGRYIAGRTSGGYISVWNARRLAFEDDEGPASTESEPARSLSYPDAPGCILDFEFVDASTIVALEAPGFMDSSDCGPVGSQLRTYDVLTGTASEPTATPPLIGLVGYRREQDRLLAIARETTDGPMSVALLDRSWRVDRLVVVEGSEYMEVVDTGVVSPDGTSAAFAMRDVNPIAALEIGEPATFVVTVDAARATTSSIPLPARSDGVSLQGLRWSNTGLLMASFSMPSDDGNVRSTRSMAHDGEAWHEIDDDPMLTGHGVGHRTQVVVTPRRMLADGVFPYRYGDLFVMHGRPYGEAGDVFAEPTRSDRAVAVDVDRVWFSPANRSEPPFVVD